MRAFALFTVLLFGLAVTDFYFSTQLLASARTDAIRNAAFRTIDSPSIAMAGTEVDMVEQALNSRYMQWGAVGVMLALFVWLITRHLPNQEKRRDKERADERAAYIEERNEDRKAFLTAMEKRDQMYLGTLAEIRRSVEEHAAKNQQANENLSTSVHELALEIRQSHK